MVNTEKTTKYAIRSLNNGDFSRKMAFFEHVLRGVLYAPLTTIGDLPPKRRISEKLQDTTKVAIDH